MKLLPGWEERLRRAEEVRVRTPSVVVVPRSPTYYSERLTFVDATATATAMAGLANERRLSHVRWVDTEFAYERSAVLNGKTVHDPRSIRPLLLSFAMVEPGEATSGKIYRFVVDLRVPSVLDALRSILRLPYMFVGHYSH